MNKIESLTEKQKALLNVYRDKWLKIGLCCEPIVFEAAVDAVKLVVECARPLNKKPVTMPQHFYYAQSPREAFEKAKSLCLGISISNFFDNTLWGCHDSDWISFYDFMKEEVGVQNLECIEGLKQLAMNAGWVTILGEHCIIQDRPSKIQFDEQRRTHCENGPAIQYRDGYSIMMWHGQRVPESWILHGLSADEALKQKNLELRRAACEIVGWANIIQQLSPTVIDEDEDPEIGTLLEVDLPDSPSRERFLFVRCGTGRDFAIPVPPSMQRARQANAWTYGLDESEYYPEVRT